MRLIGFASVLVFALLGASRAGAQVETTPASSTPASSTYAAPDTDFTVAVQLGGFASTQTHGGLVGAKGTLRWHVLEVGALLQVGGWLFFDNVSSAALMAGFAVPIGDVRLELLGIFGAHVYTAVGQEFFDDDPGTSAALGYAGATWAVSYAFVKPGQAQHIVIGAQASFDSDLTHVTRNYSYTEISNGFFGDGSSSTVNRSRRIGATRAAIMLTLGVRFDQ